MVIRLAITDDNELVRGGLVQFLGSSPGIEVVAEATNGDELLAKLRDTQVDLLLLDMSMPGMSGEELIARIKSTYPDMHILVLSMHNETQLVLRAIKAGASGYICKDCSPQTLLEAIRKVVATGRYLEPAMMEQLACASVSPDPDNIEPVLSERELEICRLSLEGNSVSEIAEQLFIGDKTVNTHKSHLLGKLELKGVVDLVPEAVGRKLFS